MHCGGTLKTRIAIAALGCLLLLAHGAEGQGAPPPGGAPGGQRAAPAPAANLKVLPKDMPRQALISKMREFNAALGVECSFCHAADPATQRTDFASDANPHKNMARVMITMTEDINAKYITQLSEHSAEHAVACGTCHMGHDVPPAFTPAPPPARPTGAGN
jgi:hypothetical protein